MFSNPPFEDFTPTELRRYKRLPGLGIGHGNKAVEVFARTIDNLPEGGVFGLVVPQLVLNGKGARHLRDRLLRQYELREVCLLPDKVFENSSVETAVLLGRRRHPFDSHERLLPPRTRVGHARFHRAARSIRGSSGSTIELSPATRRELATC